MSLPQTFHAASNGGPVTVPKPRLPPFSLRLSEAERARLTDEAKGAPLGSYIKAKVLGSALPVRLRRSGLAVEDRQALAQALALLGASRLSSNVNQLARLANIGALPVTLELETELSAALADIRSIRCLLVAALGLKAEGGSE
ncbi:hypothetical protein ACQW02_06815 [Humitalea sp. 24SJ18S-53]|uniref:hypothetical protein n=1 Tax=Humitalea sp. 24SJ18S-53 TaxID=3422307 RepID=UPI003D67EB85